jgi:60 kDa SS-A/Ro ribonucleoprotein
MKMANKNLFKSTAPSRTAPATDTVNNAGGKAYSLTAEAALAQFACTGTFSDTFYVQADKQLDEVKKLVSQVRPEFLAKLAVYSRESAFMKDMSAFLLASLMTRDLELFKKVFNRVVDNGKMLRNFVQIVRSGQVGRKSFGSAPKRMIRQWLENRKDDRLFDDSVGNEPSLKDIIKMVHPKPSNAAREALYSYLIDKDVKNPELLPESVKAFEAFKKATKGNRSVPSVNFQMLTALDLSDKEWKEVSKSMKWHALRMNLNTLDRHGVLKDSDMVNSIAERFRDEKAIKNAKVFPYQLFTAYLNVDSSVPTRITNALQDAMEIATRNIPRVKGRTVVAVDCSGSMDSPVTGARGSVTTKTTCKQVASLIAACMLRNADDVDVLRFTTTSERVKLNPRDSVITNAKTIGSINGGTAVSSPLVQLNKENAKADLVVIVSDNESWADRADGYYNHGLGTSLMKEWLKFKTRNPKAKLVCIDLAPNAHTQAQSATDRLNVGGFSDAVFDVINAFTESNGTKEFWVDKIQNEVIL